MRMFRGAAFLAQRSCLRRPVWHAPPTCRWVPTTRHRNRRRPPPIAGWGPIWAPPSAMSGAVWTTARPIRQASPAASRAATIGNAARSCSAARPISNLSGADDTISPFEFSNPWFGTLRARGGVALNNVLLYGTGGLAYRRPARGLLQPDGIPHHRRLDGRRGRRSPLQPALVGEGRMALSPAVRHELLGDRNVQQRFAADILRVGANYHF